MPGLESNWEFWEDCEEVERDYGYDYDDECVSFDYKDPFDDFDYIELDSLNDRFLSQEWELEKLEEVRLTALEEFQMSLEPRNFYEKTGLSAAQMYDKQFRQCWKRKLGRKQNKVRMADRPSTR